MDKILDILQIHEHIRKQLGETISPRIVITPEHEILLYYRDFIDSADGGVLYGQYLILGTVDKPKPEVYEKFITERYEKRLNEQKSDNPTREWRKRI